MIFYFSSTGNSLYIAEILAHMTDDKIVNITGELAGECRYDLDESEAVGIVCPVHFYGLPLNVEEFIRRISFDREAYTYLVLSYGTFPGKAMDKAEALMNGHGHRLNGKMAVKMPENYVMLFNPPSASDVRSILKEAEPSIKEFAENVRSREDVHINVDDNIWHKIFGAIARPIYLYGRGTGRFYTDTKCIKCRRCVDICPDKAIEFLDRTPVWVKDKCLRCNACINRCPKEAIQFGYGTRKRRRYVNPVTKDRL